MQTNQSYLTKTLVRKIFSIVLYAGLITSAVLVVNHSLKSISLQSRLADTMSMEGKSDLAWAELLESLSLRLYKGASDRIVQHQQLVNTVENETQQSQQWTFIFFLITGVFFIYQWQISKRITEPEHLWRHVLLLAVICLIVGLIAPMMQMTAYKNLPVLGDVIFKFEAKSILSTVASLFQHGNVVVALIITLFSILTPILKLSVVGMNLFDVSRPLHQKAHHLIHALGKWSMADVFVVAVLLSIFALDAQGFTKAQQEIGIYFFAAYCVLSLLVTNAVLKEKD